MKMNRFKLKEIANIVNGATPSSLNVENYGGNIVWITPNDLSKQKKKYIYIGERNITEIGYNSCSTKLLPVDSILLSSRAPIGLIAINKVECCTNQGFKNLVINKEKCNVEFLYYYLKYHIKEIEKLGSGTTFKEVSKGLLEDYEVLLPLMDLQNKISKVLSNIDNKIELNNKINSELEAMAKTIYDYWFLQFEFPNEEGKPYKSSGGKMVWNDELKREIPEGWEVKNLIDYCYLKNRINYNKEETVGEKYKIINVRDISSSSLFVNSNLLDEICISPNIADKYLVNKNDILIARSGSPGQVRIISIKENMIFSGFIIKCEVKESKYKEYFIYVLKKIENLISTKSNGSILKNINQESLNMLKIVIPNMEIIDNFNSKIVSIHKKIENIMEENQELTSLRDFLLPLLMNGQIGFKEE